MSRLLKGNKIRVIHSVHNFTYNMRKYFIIFFPLIFFLRWGHLKKTEEKSIFLQTFLSIFLYAHLSINYLFILIAMNEHEIWMLYSLECIYKSNSLNCSSRDNYIHTNQASFYRWKAVHLWNLWQVIYSKKLSSDAHQNSQVSPFSLEIIWKSVCRKYFEWDY